MERPDDKTIQDDRALEAWYLKKRMDDRKERLKQNKASGGRASEHETFEFE